MSKYDRLGLRRGRRDVPLRAEWVRTLALDWKRRNCWRTPTRPSMAPWGVGRGAAGSLTDRGGPTGGKRLGHNELDRGGGGGGGGVMYTLGNLHVTPSPPRAGCGCPRGGWGGGGGFILPPPFNDKLEKSACAPWWAGGGRPTCSTPTSTARSCPTFPLIHGRGYASPPPPRLSKAFLILMKPCEPSNGPVVVSPSGAGGVGEGVGHGGPVGRVPNRGKRAAVPVLSSSQSFISLMMT